MNAYGGISTLLINTARATTFAVNVSVAAGAPPPGGAPPAQTAARRTSRRLDFRLTAPRGDLRARTLELNGEELRAGEGGSLPPLTHALADGEVVELPPSSFGFFVFPDAGARPCFTPAQLAKKEAKKRKKRGSHQV